MDLKRLVEIANEITWPEWILLVFTFTGLILFLIWVLNSHKYLPHPDEIIDEENQEE